VETQPAVDTSAAYAPPAALATPAGLTPQFGGVVQALGQYIVELLSRDDGHLEAQVRDLQGQTVSPQGYEIEAEIPNGGEPVQVVMLPMDDRFVGTIPNVRGLNGRRVVELVLSAADAVEPIARTTFSDLNLVPVRVAAAAPQHHGHVRVVGDTRVEVTVMPNRRVYVSVTDLEGAPIPPSAIGLNQITLVGPAGPQVVSLQPQGALFVGMLAAPPPPNYSVVFDISYGPRSFRHVRFYNNRPAPPTVVVQVPPRFEQQQQWRRDWRWGWAPPPTQPVVVVRPGAPPPPVVVVRPGAPPPPPVVVVHPGAPPPPRVVVQPPPPPRVVVQPPPPPRVVVQPPPPPRVVVQPPPPPRVVVQPPPPPRVVVQPAPPPPVKVRPGHPPHPHGGPPGQSGNPPPGHGGPPPGGGHGRGHR
jgi:hypothetical protein